MFPQTRLRRLRATPAIRKLVRGTTLSPSNFLLPVFFKEGLQKKEEIAELKGVFRHAVSDVGEIAQECEENKIPGVLLFGIPKNKNNSGTSAFAKNGVVQKAISAFKENSNLAVFSDVCLCQYASHGHCGILSPKGVDNEKTIGVLQKIAVSHAQAGVDFAAPSAMMDGQVAAIRRALDKSGFENAGIMAYSAKFASSFYSPFRAAAQSAPIKQLRKPYLKDRATHQLDFYSQKQALREMELDLQEGADILMVKPALAYLDVIALARQKFSAPIAAYQVSGEYALLKSGVLHSRRALLESTVAIRRAGADIVISYAAVEIAKWLAEGLDEI